VSIYYLDASALVKRYVHEAGSVWLRSLFSSPQAELLFTSRMTIVEVISAFARRVREDALTSAEFSAAENAFRGDCSHDYQIMPPSLEIVDLACSLLRCHPLRAYDATHLASALSAQKFLTAEGRSPLIFLSADDRLTAAASAEGLAVDNPNLHA
jgi:predicted nucleic acid-binding protein